MPPVKNNSPNPNTAKRLAVVGAGISGLTAAYYASKLTQWDVTIFETSPRIGGHAHTHTLNDDSGQSFDVDTGFIVFNDRNYPNFRAILKELNVEQHRTEMSFSVSLPIDGRSGGFEYNGGSLGGLFVQRSQIVSLTFWKLLKEISRFNLRAKASLTHEQGLERTVGEWLDLHGFDESMVTRYLLPLAGAVWSASPQRIRDFPTRSLFHFLHNHGLLDLKDRPNWHSLRGGSQTYINSLVAGCSARFSTENPIEQIIPTQEGIELRCGDGAIEHFDYVLVACHADEALALLHQPDAFETEILGAFDYSDNKVFLHSDPAFMPIRRAAWASWNYVGSGDGESTPIAVSYWMNRLQELKTDQLMLVTLNPASMPQRVHRQLSYRHPQFDLKAIKAQQRQEELQGHRNIWYAGAYWRWGFHEDGVVSALWALRHMGVPAPLLDEMEAQ